MSFIEEESLNLSYNQAMFVFWFHTSAPLPI